MKRWLAVAILVSGVAACGDDDADAGGSAVGPGIRVSEALASDAEGRLLVNGVLFVDADGTAWLSEGLAESYPPQAVGMPKVELEGLDLETVEGLQTAQGITWTDRALQVLGEMNGDVLVVISTSNG